MVDDRFGKKIQEFREKAGKSQEELAAHVGVSVTSISNIERGANYPSFENFIKIYHIIETNLFCHFLHFLSLHKQNRSMVHFFTNDILSR